MDLIRLSKEFKVIYDSNNITKTKEAIGEAFLKKYNVFESFFPSYLAFRKITNKKLQKEGVDFIVTNKDEEEIFIDLKTDIGPDYSNIVPIEIRQYGAVTMTKDKKTDYILHVVIDDHQRKAVLFMYKHFCSIANAIAQQQTEDNKTGPFKFSHDSKAYEVFTSRNSTGEYIKFDYDTWQIDEVTIL